MHHTCRRGRCSFTSHLLPSASSIFLTITFFPPMFFFLQSEWPDCERLADDMHFQFPECQRIPLHSLISRSSSNGIHLMEHLLQWDPDRRPTAQQALRYSLFQILVRTTDTGYISLPDTQISHHNNHFNTREMALGMRYSSLDNEQWTNQVNEFATNLNSSKQNMLMGSNGSILNGELLRKPVAGNGKL